jgi:hypothetical protein
MARIRSLKPELWLSPQVMNLSHSARLMFVGLITQADDDGRGLADVRRLKAAIFPGDDITTLQVSAWLAECKDQALAALYDAAPHGSLYQLTGWHHQKIKKPLPSQYPPPPGYVPKEFPTGTELEANEFSRIGEDLIGEEERGRDAREALIDGVNPTAWKTWVDYRHQIRKPLKPVSMPAAQRTLAAFGSEQMAVVQQSVANGWQGLFPVKQINGAHRFEQPTRRAKEFGK